jgi:hypothetical protein
MATESLFPRVISIHPCNSLSLRLKFILFLKVKSRPVFCVILASTGHPGSVSSLPPQFILHQFNVGCYGNGMLVAMVAASLFRSVIAIHNNNSLPITHA